MSTLNVGTAKVTNYQDASGNPVTPARAWVNFNGTGTVAIRAAINVSSITDNGAGDYAVNFTNAFADGNYCFNITGMDNGTNFSTVGNNGNYSSSTSSLRFGVRNAGGVLSDLSVLCVSIFR